MTTTSPAPSYAETQPTKTCATCGALNSADKDPEHPVHGDATFCFNCHGTDFLKSGAAKAKSKKTAKKKTAKKK